MKKIFLLILLVLGTGQLVQAQVTVQLLVDGKPGALISDFFGNSADRLTLNAITPTARQVYFRASIRRTDNGIVIENPAFKPAQPIALNAGLNTFSGPNSSVLYAGMNGGDVDVTGIDKNGLFQSQVLPEGIYQFCVYCYDYTTDQQIGQGCQVLNIQLLEQPRIVNPMPGQIISPVNPLVQATIPVNWTPVPNAPGVRYDLKLIEVPNGVNPEEAALQSGQGALPVKFQRTDLLTPTLLIDPTSGLLLDTGKTYVLQVRAHGTNLNIRNDGLSDPVAFTYRMKPNTPVADTTAAATGPIGALSANCTCKATLSGTKTAQSPASLKAGNTFKMAGQTVSILTVKPNADGKSFSGTGTIPFPVAPSGKIPPVQIRFENVQIDGGNVAFAGLAAEDGLTDPSILPDADGQGHRIPNQPSQWLAFGKWFAKNAAKQLISSGSVNLQPSYRLPIGIAKVISGKNQVVAITGLRMDATQAVFDAVTVVDVLDGGQENAFMLKAIDVCFNSTDLCGSATLALGQDISLGLGKGKGTIRLKAPLLKNGSADTTTGTYALWDKNDGIKALQLNGQYLFDKTTIVTPTTDTVKADLKFKTAQGWDNWIATLKLPAFCRPNDTSMRFEGTTAFYDHSSIANPTTLPGALISNEGVGWTGFFMESIGVSLPPFVKSVKNPNRVTATVSNLIVDKNGITAKCNAQNILSLDDGTLDGWYFSVDKFQLQITKNSFDSGGLYGRVELPVSEHSSGAQLEYTCTLTSKKSANGSVTDFQFVVQPKNDVSFKLWVAKAKIAPSSYIKVSYTNSDLLALARINGDISIDAKIDGVPKISFTAVKIDSLTISSQAPYFNPGNTHFGFASPEKSFAGFKFTLTNIGLSAQPQLSGKKAAANVNFRFGGNLELSKISALPKASTALTLATPLSFENGRFKLGTPTVLLDQIQLKDADICGIGLSGGIAFYRDNTTYGNGFKGNIAVKFPPGFKVGSTVQFGTVAQNGADLDYWYVDASLRFPIGTGIPLFPGTKLCGFSGGAYYHMQRSKDLSTDYAAAKKAPLKSNTAPDTSGTPAVGASVSGITYIPKADVALGIKASAYFGLQADRILTCDAGFDLAFTNSGGLASFAVNGNGHYIPDANDKGILDASVAASVQWIRQGTKVVNTIFDASAQVKAGNPLFAISVPLKMHFERPDDPLWHVKLGRARTLADAQLPKGTPRPDAAYIELLSGLAKAEGYFAVGNYDMPLNMPPVPKYITDILAKSKGGGDNKVDDAAAQGELNSMKADFSEKASAASGTKPSILFGASQEFHLDQTIAIIYVKADGGYGFDAMLRNYASTCPSIGLNGWYASAQAYAGLAAALGVRVKFLGATFQQEFVSAGIAAVLSGGLPNTTFLNGEAGGYYSVLDGAVSGSFNIGFKLGSKPQCDLSSSALANVELINSVMPDDGSTDVPLATKPQIKFTFKGLAPFTLSDMNADGSIAKKRQFVFARQVNPADFDFKYTQQGGSDKNEGARIDYFVKAPGSTEKIGQQTTVYTNEYSAPPKSNTMLVYPYSLPVPLTEARLKITARLYENQNYNNGQPGSPVKWALAREGGQVFEQTKEVKYTYTSGITSEGQLATKTGTKNLVQNAWPAYGERFAHLGEKDMYGATLKPSISLNTNTLEPCYWGIPAASCKTAVLKVRLVNLTSPGTPVQVLDAATSPTTYWGGLSIQTATPNGLKAGSVYAMQYCWNWPDAGSKPAPQDGSSAVENALKTPSNFLPIYTNVFSVSKYATAADKEAALKTAGAYFGPGGHLSATQLQNGPMLRTTVKAMTDAELLTPAELAAAKKEAKAGGGGLFYSNGISPAMAAAMDTLNYWRILPYHLDLTGEEPFSEYSYTTSGTNASSDANAAQLQATVMQVLKLSAADTAQMKIRPLQQYAMQEETVNEAPDLTDAEIKSGTLNTTYASGKDACSKQLAKPVYLQRSYNRLEAGSPKDPPQPGGGGVATNVINQVMGQIRAKKDLGRPSDFIAIGQLYDVVTNQANQAGWNAAQGLYGNQTSQMSNVVTNGQLQNAGVTQGVNVNQGVNLNLQKGGMKGKGQ
ncbi:MAG: hypothetical protein EOP52_00365 [Sphingobacteriales bacterium]|nr:MAG: hypothetical protein EOP52_00365 [Sphingobacteriales bacterium]